MEIQDRSPIAEEIIFQLWELNYFSSLELTTEDGRPVFVISLGQRNLDSGPDFKNIAIKINNQIFQGDLEIHRSANDWYLHGHHHDSAYNNVILHLVIGSETSSKPILRLNQRPVLALVFVDISEQQIDLLSHQYQLSLPVKQTTTACKIADNELNDKLLIIEHAGQTRLMSKAERFKEDRQLNSWNQIIYMGIMEALGYSKNQRPFRKLAQLLPFEVISRELHDKTESSIMKIQALLFGAAGLLTSQDPRLLIKDTIAAQYISELEKQWTELKSRIGIIPMKREEWQFFRLRPTNFPTRRIAGASYIWARFAKLGLLETFLQIFHGLQDHPDQLINELESLFICINEGFWANHYLFEEQGSLSKQPTLVGQERVRDIIVNIVLPNVFAYAEETENGRLKASVLQIYRQYPKLATNQIIRDMVKYLLINDNKLINTALKQQGLIHLNQMYCRNEECDRCMDFVKEILN